MIYLDYFIKLPWILIRLFLHFASSKTKKNNHLWIFGAWDGNNYSDNSKALFVYVLKNQPKIKAFWITKNKKLYQKMTRDNLPVIYYPSIKSIYISIRARIFFITNGKDDIIDFLTTKKSIVVQLWHGSPIKKILKDNKFESYHQKRRTNLNQFLFKTLFPYKNISSNIIVAASEKIKQIFKRAFNTPDHQIHVLGYPRNDQLFNISKKEKTILYLPTKRDYIKNIDYLSTINSERLNSVLENHSSTLLIKYHNHEQGNFDSKYIKLCNTSDIYDELNKASILITDYSSVMFDFVLLGRPIIHYLFDHDNYLKNERELYEKIETIACGPIAKTKLELANELDDVLSGKDEYKEKRESIKKMYNKYDDNQSSKRIIELVTKRITSTS